MIQIGSHRAILAAIIFFLSPPVPLFAATAACDFPQRVPSALTGIAEHGEESLNAPKFVIVGSSSELAALLNSDANLATIFLQPGVYDPLTLRDLRFPNPVRLTSLNPTTPAQITRLNLHNVTGICFDQIHFTGPKGMHRHSRPFQISQSTNIGFRIVEFYGPTPLNDHDFPQGQGLFIDGASQISLMNSQFRFWHRAFITTHSNNILIRNNLIEKITSDGLNFSAARNVRIEDNDITDFLRDLSSDDHADMIQFWTRGTKTPNLNITIRGNRLDAGNGWYTQSIFMRNEVMDADPSMGHMAYQNVLIEGNRIKNAHLHGITVGQSRNLTIRYNHVTRLTSAAPPSMRRGLSTPSIRVHPNSTGVTINNNRAPAIIHRTNDDSWQVGGNSILVE